MSFEIKTLYPTDTAEAICTALLTIIALKSFEYILKTLLISAGSERVSTNQFALSVATNQAWNPLNFISWFRASPDFDVRTGTANEIVRRRIPLQRATIALLIALMALLAEGAFFYGTQNRRVEISDKNFKITLNQTNEDKETIISNNACKPIPLDTGRANLNGVFAACNKDIGQVPLFGQGTSLRATISLTEYSISVKIEGNTTITSTTEFMLLLPEGDNLVVQLRGYIQEQPSTDVYNHYEGLGCRVDRTRDVNDLILEDCSSPIEPFPMLEKIVKYIGIVQNEPPSRLGTISGDRISPSNGKRVVGSITQQNFTAVGILAITGVLFLLSIICYSLVTDDTNEVIACILREKTGQDYSIPAISMSEGVVRIVRSFSERNQKWHLGTYVPEGFEEKD